MLVVDGKCEQSFIVFSSLQDKTNSHCSHARTPMPVESKMLTMNQSGTYVFESSTSNVGFTLSSARKTQPLP